MCALGCVVLCLSVFLSFEAGSHYVAQADLEYMIFLSWPPECWDYRHSPPCSDDLLLLTQFKSVEDGKSHSLPPTHKATVRTKLYDGHKAECCVRCSHYHTIGASFCVWNRGALPIRMKVLIQIGWEACLLMVSGFILLPLAEWHFAPLCSTSGWAENWRKRQEQPFLPPLLQGFSCQEVEL
jgi:hypothetical protein